jgi:hypothetical protein
MATTGTPIDDLKDMSVKGRTALKAAGYSSLEAAAEASDATLTALSGFGDSSLKRLRLWQAGEPQPDGPAVDRKREDRIWELYGILRGSGLEPPEALRNAVNEVDAILLSLRAGSA